MKPRWERNLDRRRRGRLHVAMEQTAVLLDAPPALFKIPGDEPLPDHQRKAILELRRYRRTGALRRMLSTFRYSPEETARLVYAAAGVLPMKKNEIRLEVIGDGMPNDIRR